MSSIAHQNTPENDTDKVAETAPRELNRLEVLRGLRVATWEASFSTVWASLTTGAFLTGFALWLGAGSVVMGLITAIPTFAGLVQILSSYLGERLNERKKFTAWFSVFGRTLWIPILLLPVLLPPKAALIPFLILLALSYVALNVPIPAYMSWMSDLVPPDHRGRYFGRRNMIAGMVGMLISLPAARWLDFSTRQHHWEALGYGVLFGVGALGGLLSFACLLRQPEPPKRPAAVTPSTGLKGIWEYYKTPFADPNFRRLMLFNVVFVLGQYVAAPFYAVYALQVLKLNFVWLQIFATLTSIASLASMPLWGYLADKFGNKPLLIIGVFGVSTLPITWLFTTPDNPMVTLLLVAEVNIAGGLFWAGVQLTQFNLLIRSCPSEKTPVYVAMMAAVTGLMGGLAPLLGSMVMEALDGWSGRVLGMTWSNYQVTFLLSAIVRLVSVLFLRPVADERAVSARDVLHQLSRSSPRAWLHIRRLQRGGGEEEKLRATEALAESRTRLAVAELTAALNDPSQAVREEAARALGEIGDPASVEALVTVLRDPAAGSTEAAARALGRIGDRSANAALIGMLEHRWNDLARAERLALVYALGELGGEDAVQALLSALETASVTEAGDEEIEEALVLALGRIGEARVAPALLAILEQSPTSRPLRLALIRALGALGDTKALPVLRSLLETSGSDPILVMELADAFAHLNDTEAILPLLSLLPGLESPIARKQLTSAVGTLLGIGSEVYALLAHEDFARDAALTRLFQELQRRLRSAAASERITALQQDYHLNDYAACLRSLAALVHADADIRELSEREQRCLEVIDRLASSEAAPQPVEAVLLALCAARLLLDREG